MLPKIVGGVVLFAGVCGLMAAVVGVGWFAGGWRDLLKTRDGKGVASAVPVVTDSDEAPPGDPATPSPSSAAPVPARADAGAGTRPPGTPAPSAEHRVVVARVRSGILGILGALSKDVIRKGVVPHLSEVRSCYVRGLAVRPALSGRVALRFVIGPSGAVQSGSVGDSTLGAPDVERCLAEASLGWHFPSPPGGGIVVVDYPFVFDTEDVGESAIRR